MEHPFRPYTKGDTKVPPLFGVKKGAKVTPNATPNAPYEFGVYLLLVLLYLGVRRPYQASEDPTKPQKTLPNLEMPYQASEAASLRV